MHHAHAKLSYSASDTTKLKDLLKETYFQKNWVKTQQQSRDFLSIGPDAGQAPKD